MVVRRESFEDLTARDVALSARPPADGAAAPFKVGLLGHGTVGAAFAELLDERADEIERFNGRRPVISGRAHALARATSRRSSPTRT